MKHWLKIGVAAILVWFLIEQVDWVSVGTILLGASLPWVVLYICLQLLGNLISARKWQYLGRIQGFHFSLKESFFAYLAGAFINNFLPSTIGGDTYRTLWMKKNGDGWQAFTVVFFDRFSGLLALFLLGSLGFLVLPWSTWAGSPWLLILAAVVLSITIVIIFSFFSVYSLFELTVTLSEFFPWERITNFIRRFQVFAEARVYLTTIFYSLLFSVIGVAFNNYALFQGLDANIPFFPFLGCIFLATLLASIPISINNIGIKEWSYIFFFGLIGLSPEYAVAIALLSRFIQMLLSLLGMTYFLHSKKEFSH